MNMQKSRNVLEQEPYSDRGFRVTQVDFEIILVDGVVKSGIGSFFFFLDLVGISRSFRLFFSLVRCDVNLPHCSPDPGSSRFF